MAATIIRTPSRAATAATAGRDGPPRVAVPADQLPGPGAANFETTGWHYHDCRIQFAWVAEGAIDIAFDDGAPIRATTGIGKRSVCARP
jgi:hypothetical protein